MRLSVTLAFTFIFVAPNLLKAGEIISESGIVVRDGGWNVQNVLHADPTYVTFLKMRKKPLEKYDYYYQLRVRPQFRVLFEDCDGGGSRVRDFLKGVFGTSDSALAMLSVGVGYRWSSGNQVEVLKDTVPMVIIGRGADPKTLKPGNGCFFDATSEPTFPLLRYEGGLPEDEFDEFILKFTIDGGEALESSLVGVVKTAFSSFNTAFSWSQISVGKVSAYETAATDFQNGIKAAGSFRNHISKNYRLKPQGIAQSRLVVTIPNLVESEGDGLGTLVIWVRPVASIILQKAAKEITPLGILQDEGLGARKCASAEIASGKCSTTSESARNALLSILSSDKDPLPVDIFDPTNSANRKKTFDLCQRIRIQVTEKMRLSTIDALLLRWAVTVGSGLKAHLDDASKLKLIAEESMKTSEEIKQMCWNEKDTELFNAIVTDTGKTAVVTQRW